MPFYLQFYHEILTSTFSVHGFYVSPPRYFYSNLERIKLSIENGAVDAASGYTAAK